MSTLDRDPDVKNILVNLNELSLKLFEINEALKNDDTTEVLSLLIDGLEAVHAARSHTLSLAEKLSAEGGNKP